MHLKKMIPAAALFATSSPAAMAFTIGFESSEGYTAGSALHNQPASGVKWTNSTGLATVVDLGGNQAAQYVPASTSPAVAGFSQARYMPTAASFGTTSGAADDATSAGFTGQVAYSFEVGMNTAGSASAGIVATIKLGNDDIELYVQADGRMQVRSPNGNFIVKDNSNSDFDFDSYGLNTFVTVSGIANYTTDSFTLSVNGVTQLDSGTSGNGTANIPFKSVTTDQFNLIMFQNNVASSDANYKQLMFDNFDVSVVPEPAGAAMIGVGLSVFALHRGNKK